MKQARQEIKRRIETGKTLKTKGNEGLIEAKEELIASRWAS